MELENLPRGWNKYDGMENTMNPAERVDDSGSGWDIDWSEDKAIGMYRLVYKYFDFPAEEEVRRERTALHPDRGFHWLICHTIVSEFGD